MADLTITIDGPAASGKSTVAQLLADKLGASFLDTGAMYRAVTLAAMQAGVDMKNERQLLDLARKCKLVLSLEAGKTRVSLNNVDVTDRIRDADVTANARYVAGAPEVRAELVRMQQQFASEREKVVTEGRDQGTVAFQDADVKFFLTADPAERARRRRAELKVEGQGQSLDEIRRAIEERDISDQSRDVGPLKPAEDAIIVETTALSIDEVVEKLLAHVKERCLENS